MPRRTLPIVPDTAVGIIMSSDVPLATRSLVPKTSMSAGTTMIPPPTPRSPARMPVTTPSARRPRTVSAVEDQHGIAGGDDEEEHHDDGAEEATNPHRSAVIGTRGSS